MVEIIPSILTNNPIEATELLKEADGKVDRIQIDVVDGVFADNKTVDSIMFQDVDTSLLLDFHLMVKEPVNWVEKCVRAGGVRIIGQIEMMENQVEFVDKILSTSALPGLAIDLKTPVSNLEQDYLREVDIILIMSVKAGFGGQEFNDKVLEKIDKLNKIRKENKMKFKICIDGGVTLEKMGEICKKNVEEVSIGRRIFEGDMAMNLKKFKEVCLNQSK